VWVDKSISPGTPFHVDIQHAIQTSDIAFLLISDHFFKSKFILDVELPAIKARVAQKRLVMIPIKVGSFEEADYRAQFNDLQAWPLKQGRLISISELEPSEKRYAFGDLHRWAVTARKLWGRKVEMKPLNPVTGRVLKATAEKLAALYGKKTPKRRASWQMSDETIYGLAWTFWILWEVKRDHDAAKKLAKEFRAKLTGQKIELDDGHKPTIDLLEVGLPKEPAHLQLLEVSNVSNLLDPQYAKLLYGMRLSELDYRKAGHFFSELRRTQPVFQRCALVSYAWGQCLRKHQELLVDAIDRLELARNHCGEWGKETCDCPGGCPRGMLLIEIYRGLGAAHRRAGNRDLALRNFKEGEKLLDREDVPAHIKADFLYSYGYFLFEDAVTPSVISSSWHLTPEQENRLKKARQLFRKCLQFEREHPAAHARLEIVNKLLGNFNLKGWIHSRTLCLGHMHGETILTSFLSGFAIRLYSLTVDASVPVGVNSQELYHELADAFESWPNGVPLGPINCHFFDLAVVRWDTNLKRDKWLRRAFDLLKTSRQWKETTPGNLRQKQLEGLRNFEAKHKIKRH
jgi:tetratricopeptide (TPR) repeat protein